MRNVLVATLGNSPIVVTAMVRALSDHPDGPGVQVDEVRLIYPHRSEESKTFIDIGADMIEQELAVHGIVTTRTPIDGNDVDSRSAALAFLRALDSTLEGYRLDRVYVSCAGGRKIMSALAAVVTQFHPHVQGVYHVLDRYEHDPDRRSLFTIEELFQMGDSARQRTMDPPIERLNLVCMPHRALTNAAALRAALGKLDNDDKPLEIGMSDTARAFFAQLFGGPLPSDKLEISFTQRAAEQFRNLDHSGSTHADAFWTCFGQMREPALLYAGRHGSFKSKQQRDVVYHFFKRRRTPERPFFYTEPYDISLFPGKPVQRVTVVGLSIESEDVYDSTGDEWVAREPFMPTRRLGDLRSLPALLMIPLGETPMVATQFFTLLRQREQQQMQAIWLLYPEDNQQIRSDVQLLRRLFTATDLEDVRGCPPVRFESRGIPDLSDVDSVATCELYAHALDSAIRAASDAYPDAPVRLLISGGRKVMAALAYYAAQLAGLPEVWHTVITDPELERRVLQETGIAARGQPDWRGLAEKYFLRAYQNHADCFALYGVPVIPLQL